MFGLFKSPEFRDPQLGVLSRSRGYWRGSVKLSDELNVPLVVSGTRTKPDRQALELARTCGSQFASLRTVLETALFEHYEPYAEAVASGELDQPSEDLPRIVAPRDVWAHVAPLYVSVTSLDGALTTEIGLAVAWDEEHTLGARFRPGEFVELSGSVLRP